MPGLEASGAPLHAATLLSTARAEHRGGKSRLARWELLTARVLCLFAGTTGVYPRAYRKGTRSRVRRVARAEHRGSKSQLVAFFEIALLRHHLIPRAANRTITPVKLYR